MSEHPELDRLQEKIRRLHGLIETSGIVSSSLELEEVLRLVLERAQQIASAEASAILLYNAETRKLEFEVALGEKGPMLQSLRRTLTLELGQGIAGSVAQTRRAEWVPDAGANPRLAKTVDAATGFVTRNVLCAPLLVHDRLIGVAEVMNLAHPERCGPDDVEIFTTFCQQVAIAIDNARLHRALLEQERERQQLEFASVIQQSFLPARFPTCPRQRFQVDAKSVPASAVGGDFYDFLTPEPDRLAVVIGDVSGKGVPAALFMAKLISDLHFIGQKVASPQQVLEAMNRDLSRQERRGMFVTAQFFVLDAESGAVRMADGGHVPALWYHRRTDAVEILDLPGGPPLGILPEVAYPESTLQLQHGDSLLLLTDGVLECTNDGEAFGFPRLLEAVRTGARGGGLSVTPVLRAVEAFRAGGRQQDDLTLVALTWC